MTRPRQQRLTAVGRRFRSVIATVLGLAALTAVDRTQDAVANGDTRSITILHEHTKESGTITFRRNGAYDAEGLRQLNWILRDWRLDEQIRMDPRLFDIVWQVYREVGSQEPIHVVSGYRSPQTNASLRRRSRAVAEHSQHMLGKAMDFYLPDVSMARVRELGMRLQRGGVGFYPNAMNPFVHIDAAGVRSWPRMSRPQLASLFPDGRTVHMPRDGKPMPGYEEAKATILANGGTVPGMAAYADAGDEPSVGKSLWAMLFGRGDDEDSRYYGSRGRTTPPAPTRVAALAQPDTGKSFVPGLGSSAPAETADAEPKTAPPTPLPPHRPADLGRMTAAVARLPPQPGRGKAVPDRPACAPAEIGLDLRGEARQPSVVPGTSEERAALRSLFEAALTRTMPKLAADIATSRVRPHPLPTASTAFADPGPNIRTVFSSVQLDEPEPGAFRGAAVARLATAR